MYRLTVLDLKVGDFDTKEDAIKMLLVFYEYMDLIEGRDYTIRKVVK